MQQGDFEAIYEAMQGLPVTIRFLDPPLHEFVPHTEEEIKELSEDMHISVEEIHNVIDSLHEFNPMMGHRGCRLAVSYPEIAEMQTTAVIRAAINVSRKHPDWDIVPEIMIPLVGEVKELAYVKIHRHQGCRRDHRQRGRSDSLQGRYHDRDPARGRHRRRDCAGSGVLLLRHQRPDPDDLWLQP